jgi:hypothetical protein
MPIPSSGGGSTTTPTLPAGTVLSPSPTADLGPIPWERVDSVGVEWHLNGLDGWWDTPDTVDTIDQRPDDHGAVLGPSYLAPRTITLTGTIIGGDRPTLEAALDRLNAALPVGVLTTLRVDGTPSTQTMVRRRGPIRTSWIRQGLVQVQVPLLAPDPRRYDSTPQSQTVSVAPSSTGLAWPVTPPLLFPGAPRGGSFTATNTGTITAPWQARLEGPLPSPVLTHVPSGARLGFDLDIGAGEALDIDSLNKAARLNGVASRSGYISNGSTWWQLPPGASEIRLDAGTTDAPGRLVFTYASARI